MWSVVRDESAYHRQHSTERVITIGPNMARYSGKFVPGNTDHIRRRKRSRSLSPPPRLGKMIVGTNTHAYCSSEEEDELSATHHGMDPPSLTTYNGEANLFVSKADHDSTRVDCAQAPPEVLHCRPHQHSTSPHHDPLSDSVRKLSLADLSVQTDSFANPSLRAEGRAIVCRVASFFEKMKNSLGDSAKGTIFNNVSSITSIACGVSRATVQSLQKSDAPTKMVIPKREPRKRRTRKDEWEASLRNHDEFTKDFIRILIHRKFKTESTVVLRDLLKDLKESLDGFDVSATTFYRMLKSMGFSFRTKNVNPEIYEKFDLMQKRAKYLLAVDAARKANNFLVFTDETWVFSGMVTKRSWHDNNIKRWARRQVLDSLSCGPRAGKNKGKRGIVLAAISEEGIIPNAQWVIVSGKTVADGDYHGDMDHVKFESCVQTIIQEAKKMAGGRKVSLIMDNASYHSRLLNRIPTKSDKKQPMIDFLLGVGVALAEKETRQSLFQKIEDYCTSVGGRDLLKQYAVEKICEDEGAEVIRLPPYHCIYNPIELTWSQLKYHCCKDGKTTDKLAQVKDRTEKWLKSVTPEMCAAWCRKARREEDEAREKEGLDRAVPVIAPVVVPYDPDSDGEDVFAEYYNALDVQYVPLDSDDSDEL